MNGYVEEVNSNTFLVQYIELHFKCNTL